MLRPVVQWVGGKRQLLGVLRGLMPDSFGAYFEPFFGGGALFFDLEPRDAVVCDINEQLVNVYRCLMRDDDLVVEWLKSFDECEVDKDFYYSMRDRYNRKIEVGELGFECAALFLWVNKHCFNGKYRVNKSGFFNGSYNKKVVRVTGYEDNLRRVGRFLRTSGVSVRCGDFEEGCAGVGAGDFVYFDSPYAPVSSASGFVKYSREGFGVDEHARLAGFCRRLDELGVMFMLSNSNSELVRSLYDGFRVVEVDALRKLGGGTSVGRGVEVVVTNY